MSFVTVEIPFPGVDCWYFQWPKTSAAENVFGAKGAMQLEKAAFFGDEKSERLFNVEKDPGFLSGVARAYTRAYFSRLNEGHRETAVRARASTARLADDRTVEVEVFAADLEARAASIRWWPTGADPRGLLGELMPAVAEDGHDGFIDTKLPRKLYRDLEALYTSAFRNRLKEQAE